MNFFGKFSYGNLIKTFIPGMFILIGIIMILDAYSFWIIQKYYVLEFASKNTALTIAIIIPLSIFIGIISNSLCFTHIIDRHIVNPFNINNKEFIRHKNKIINEMKEHYYSLLGYSNITDRQYLDHFDVRSFLLNKKNMDNLQYLRESYWYYMEFQINSIIAMFIILIGFTANILLRYNADITDKGFVFPYIAIALILYYFLTKLFMSAAHENYNKHEKKSLSYLIGAYHVCKYGNIDKNINITHACHSLGSVAQQSVTQTRRL